MVHPLQARARWWRRLGGCLLSGGLLWLSLARSSPAQITLDGSLGSRGPLAGPHYTIPADMGQIRGRNLFHSFGQFNIQTGGSATFMGPDSIRHILSRVTGGQRSTIDGTLRSTIPGAHLYLINPSGVLFGPNARLDVSGSFHVSTADYLRLADGARFHARLSETSTLSVAPPAAFGFLGENPAAITIQGSSLRVANGQTLSVVGGDITLMGMGQERPTEQSDPTLGAPSGRIQVVSMASPGEVLFSPLDLMPDLQVDSFARLGRIELSRGAFLNVSGNGGGAVVVRGGRLLVDNSSIYANNLGNLDGAGLGIDLQITADAVLTNRTLVTSGSQAAGHARDLRLVADHVSLEQASAISSFTFGPGQGGSVWVTATDTLTLTGARTTGPFGFFPGPSSISTSAAGTGTGAGNAGNVIVEAPRVVLTASAQISSLTVGPGQGGSVRVTATDTLTLAGVPPDPSFVSPSSPVGIFTVALGGLPGAGAGGGNAGNVIVKAPRVALTAGAQISSLTVGPGQGGSVRVTATDTLTLAGFHITSNAFPPGPSSIFTRAAGTGTGAGNAGNVIVEAPRVALTAGAEISSTTSGPGQGGSVRVTATDTLTLAGVRTNPFGFFPSPPNPSGIFAVAAGTGTGAGNAGSIDVQAPTVRLVGGLISTQSSGPGRAGDLTLRAGTLTLTEGAQLASSTRGDGLGGNLQVTATELLNIAGRDPATARPSGIVSATLEGSGTPGTVALTAPTLRLADGALIGGSPVPLDIGTDGAVIIRGTPSPGRAADLVITAGTLTLSGAAAIVSSTPNAQPGGEITVVADRVQLTGGARIESTSGIADAAGAVVSGPGPGGRISITATDSVAITGQNSGLSTSTAGAGPGGEITLHAPRVELTDGATIAAESTGMGNAGNVTITTPDSFLSTHGRVVTRASQADGGNIQITARNLLRLHDSAITAEVGGGAQTTGGNITIDPQFIVLQNSQISANASAGRGGNVRLQAQQVFLADPASTVSASSALGINGQVDIQSPVKSITGALVPLPQSFARATELLRNRCAERVRTGTTSRFVLGGRDGVPLEPGSWLPSAFEPMDQQPPAPSAQMPQARHRDRGGDVRIDNPGQEQGQYVQIRWPDGLDVECTRWLRQQRTR